MLAASLPHRKPRRSKKCPDAALTDAQRANNRVHARRLMKVEHAISGAKQFGCLAQTFRNQSNADNGHRLRHLELAFNVNRKAYLGTSLMSYELIHRWLVSTKESIQNL